MSDLQTETLRLIEEMKRAQQQDAAARGRLSQVAGQTPQAGFANPGQGNALANPTDIQRRALLDMTLGFLGRDRKQQSGVGVAEGIRQGMGTLDTLRRQQYTDNVNAAAANVSNTNATMDDAIRQTNAVTQARLAQQKESGPSGPKLDGPVDYQRYLIDQQQGFQGTFSEWRKTQEDPDTFQGEYGVEFYSSGPNAGQPVSPAEYQRAHEKATSTYTRAAELELAGYERVVDSLEQAEQLADEAFATGLPGQVLRNIGGTAANNLRTMLGNVLSSIGFDRLQQMREESPTGGALGQVSERELDTLQATIASLDQSQSKAQFVSNLRRVLDHYNWLMGMVREDYQKFGGGPMSQPEDTRGKKSEPIRVGDFTVIEED